MQEEPLCTCFMNTLQETGLCTFWTIQTVVSSFLCTIWPQFDHLAAPFCFRSSVLGALQNTKTMLLDMFYFPDVYSCGNSVAWQTISITTLLEAHQCTFWTLVMETSLLVDNAWLCLQLDRGAAHLGSRSFVQRDANNTETVLFTIFFTIVRAVWAWGRGV